MAAEELRKLALTLHYLLVSYVLIFSLERSRSTGQLKEENSCRPNVYTLVIAVSFYNLRGHIINSSAECLSFTKIREKLLNRRVSRPSEVRHFNDFILNEDVFRLYVSVNNVLVVHVLQRSNALFGIVGGLLF